MTKLEYMVELTRALSFLDKEARDAALDFYNEMLEDRLEETGSEEAAVAAMERPADIAARMRQEMAAPAAPVHAENAPTDDLTDEWSERTFTCPIEGLHAAKLQAANMMIEIVPATDGRVTLTYFTRRQDVYTAQVQDDVLTLTHQSDSSLVRRFFQGSFSLSFYRPTPLKVTLRLPADAALDIWVKAGNASMLVQGMNALGILTLQSSNGGITAENVHCHECTLHTTNARIILEHVTSKTILRANSSNGQIAASRCHADGEITLTTSNSRVTANDISSDAPLLLRTSNGSAHAHRVAVSALTMQSSNGALEVEAIRAQSVVLRTSNGSIRGTLPGSQADWQIDSGTSNGKNSLPNAQAGTYPLSAHTSNSSISLSFEK